jgi:hypothetical protein
MQFHYRKYQNLFRFVKGIDEIVTGGNFLKPGPVPFPVNSSGCKK